MEYIEFTGKTVEDAITNASIKLGASRDNIDYVVIEKGSTGFLGIFNKPAIIKAKTKNDVDEFAQAIMGETKVEKKAEEKKPEAKPQVKHEVKPEVKKEFKADKPVEKKQYDRKPVEKKPEPVKEAAVVEDDEDIEKSSKKAVAGPNMVPAIKKFLGDVLAAMDIQAEVEVKVDEANASVEVNLNGKDMGVLIGKRGQTLDSLQYLVSLVANKETEGYFRVKLDTENYRERRKETLESLARNIAYKVKRTRRPVSLEPMNPYERRIIHSALQNDRYVSTRSEGEEPFRHVVVYLKRY